MNYAVMAKVQRFYKVWIPEDEADGKTPEEIEELARRKIEDEGLEALSFDDTPFEPEIDVLELWYDYAWNNG